MGVAVLAQNPAVKMQASKGGGNKSEVFQNVSYPSDVNESIAWSWNEDSPVLTDPTNKWGSRVSQNMGCLGL